MRRYVGDGNDVCAVGGAVGELGFRRRVARMRVWLREICRTVTGGASQGVMVSEWIVCTVARGPSRRHERGRHRWLKLEQSVVPALRQGSTRDSGRLAVARIEA